MSIPKVIEALSTSPRPLHSAYNFVSFLQRLLIPGTYDLLIYLDTILSGFTYTINLVQSKTRRYKNGLVTEY